MVQIYRERLACGLTLAQKVTLLIWQSKKDSDRRIVKDIYTTCIFLAWMTLYRNELEKPSGICETMQYENRKSQEPKIIDQKNSSFVQYRNAIVNSKLTVPR